MAFGADPVRAFKLVAGLRKLTRRFLLVKLTPNITDILLPGRAAVEAGADGLALINTIKSIIGVDLDRLAPHPVVDGKSSHGGFAGTAVKPVALHMVAALARDPAVTVPISGIGGISSWRDCAEFLVTEKVADPDRLFAEGRSAGGLLIGAVVNMRPDLWRGVVTEVPFVDVITSMMVVFILLSLRRSFWTTSPGRFPIGSEPFPGEKSTQ